MNPSLKRVMYVFIFLLFLASLLVFLQLFITSGISLLLHNPKAMDFLAFYTGGKMLLDEPSNLYNLHAQILQQQIISPITKPLHIFLPFLNPPFVDIIFIPLVLLPQFISYVVWLICNTALLLVLCVLSIKEVDTYSKSLKALMVIGIIFFIPTLTSLLIGQLTFIICLVFLLTWILLKKGHKFSSGFMLSLIVIKPHFFILPFLAMVIQRQWKIVAGIITGVLLLVLISFLIVGIQGMNTYLTLILSASQWNTGYGIDIGAQHSLQTVIMILMHTKSLSDIRIIWIILDVLICLPTLFFWVKKYTVTSYYYAFRFASLVVATLLTSPHTHFHDLTLLIVVAVVSLSAIPQKLHKLQLTLIKLILLGYLVILSGYIIEVNFISSVRQAWILLTVSYMLFLWFYLLYKLAKKTYY